MKYVVFICVVCFSHIASLAQSGGQTTNPDGRVIITDVSPVPSPYEKAILELKSETKGVLVPRHTSESMKKITPLVDGLLIFVTDATMKGYWYYNEKEKNWLRLKFADETPQVIDPLMSVVMYSGVIDGNTFDPSGKGIGKMVGWAICNGENGTPNLKGRFLVMGGNPNTNDPNHPNVEDFKTNTTDAVEIANNYNEIGNTGGFKEITLTNDQLPKHNHKIKNGSVNVSHSHTAQTTGHDHKFEKEYATTNDGQKADDVHLVKAENVITEETSPALYTNPTGPQLDPYVGTVDFIFNENSRGQALNLTGGDSENGNQTKPYENRPPYYVLVYIMRIGTEVLPTFQNKTIPGY